MAILAWPETAERNDSQAISDQPEPGAERRSERRFSFERAFATATIMGEEDRQQPCRILDASRSGMRIGLKTPLPVGVQIHVRWENNFFVGASRYRGIKQKKSKDHTKHRSMIQRPNTRDR